jgi:hypothetical protein
MADRADGQSRQGTDRQRWQRAESQGSQDEKPPPEPTWESPAAQTAQTAEQLNTCTAIALVLLLLLLLLPSSGQLLLLMMLLL